MLKDSAICIRLMDWSESSQIAVLMTEASGKLSAVAKGAKRQQPSTLGKFSGGLELLSLGEAVFITKRTAEMVTLTEWDLLDAHWGLRKDWRAYNLAMYAADLVHHLVQDRDPHPRTFAALRDFLRAIAAADPAGAAQGEALLRFQWAVVVDMGFEPVLDRDAETGEVLGEKIATVAFSAMHGGVVADTGAADRWRTRRQTVDLLRAVARGENPATDGEALERANRLLCVYLRAILDQQLPTMAYVLGE